MKEMTKRILSVAVLFLITGVSFFLSRATALLALGISGILCCNELSNALSKLGYKPLKDICFVIIIIAGFMMYFREKIVGAWFMAAIVLFAAVTFLWAMVSKNIKATDVLMTFAMFIYPVMPFIAILYIATIGEYRKYVWLAIFFTGFFAAILCDTFALFGGKLFGKHKLAPQISPKKTFEGTLIGFLFSVAGGALFWLLFTKWLGWIECPVWKYMIVSGVCSSIGQVGDLSASFIKREVGIKDYGNLIPGHGGMLDRMDSMLFAIPTSLVMFGVLGIIQ